LEISSHPTQQRLCEHATAPSEWESIAVSPLIKRSGSPRNAVATTYATDRSNEPLPTLLRFQSLVLNTHHAFAVGEIRCVDKSDDPLVTL